ncbi:MAG: hypothetical protein AAF288_07890 [Planctomycetota bacterium]
MATTPAQAQTRERNVAADNDRLALLFPAGRAETPHVLGELMDWPVILMAMEPSAQAPRIDGQLKALGINRRDIRLDASARLRKLGVEVFDNHPDFSETVKRVGVGYTVVVEYDVAPRAQGINGPVASTMTLSVRVGPLVLPNYQNVGLTSAEVYRTQRRTRIHNGGESVAVLSELLDESMAELREGLRKARNRGPEPRPRVWAGPRTAESDQTRAFLRQQRRRALERQAEAEREAEAERREQARAAGHRGGRAGDVELSAGPDASPQEVLAATMSALRRGDRAEAEAYFLPERELIEVRTAVLDNLEAIGKLDASARAAFGRPITSAHPYNSDYLRRQLVGPLGRSLAIGDRLWDGAAIAQAQVNVLGDVARVRLRGEGGRLVLMRRHDGRWQIDLLTTLDNARNRRGLERVGRALSAVTDGLASVEEDVLAGVLVTERSARQAFEARVNQCVLDATRGW